MTPLVRIIVSLVTGLVLLLTLLTAEGATANLNWVAPTLNTDGSAITGSLTYNVYRGTSATSLVKIGTSSTTSYTDANAPVGTDYYAVTAVNSYGVESVYSNVASKVIAAPTPNPPVLTVSTTAYDLRYWKDRSGISHPYVVVVGTVSLGQACYEYAATVSGTKYYLLNKSQITLTRAYYGRLTGRCA